MKLKDINAVAKCPYCGSTNIDSFIILGVNGRRITTKWCEDCGYEYDNVVCPRCGAVEEYVDYGNYHECMKCMYGGQNETYNTSSHPGEFICDMCESKTKLATVTYDGSHPKEPNYCPYCGREVVHDES